MQNELKIVGIQAQLVWENPKENIIYFSNIIHNLEDQVDLIVLPEMFTTGFTMQPKKVAESMNGKTLLWMKELAIQKNTAITGSIVIKDDNKFYNRLVFVYPSGEVATYDKRHSFTLAGEHKEYTSGKNQLIVTYKGWKICPLICYDLRFPVWVRNTMDYDLLIFMANWPVKRINAWNVLLKARAIENMSYAIGVNRVGLDANNYEYAGHSAIIDGLGNEKSVLPVNESGIVSATIVKSEQDEIRVQLGFLNDRDSFKIL